MGVGAFLALRAATPAAQPATGSAEQRRHRRAFEYWRRIAGGRRFPTLDDVDMAGAGELRDNLFLLSVEQPATACRYLDMAPELVRALGFDPTGRRIDETLTGDWLARVADAVAYAVEIGNPMEECGQAPRPGGTGGILYRSIYLPLSQDQRTVDYVLGAFSFRFTDA